MGLPASLGEGVVAVYGNGVNIGMANMIPQRGNVKFGTIYQVGDVTPRTRIYDSVMFREQDVICRLAWDTQIYTIVEEAKLVLTERP